MKLHGKTTEESIESNQSNREPPGSFYHYKPAVRQKLDEIDMAIAANVRAAKIARGEQISDAGYSGRKTRRV